MATTQDRIIQAALELISQRGLNAVTMIEVARTAGVARATLYNHYPDVPSILTDAATRHNDEAIAGLRQALAVAGSPTDTIEGLVRFVATISAHGHTLEAHHGLPPALRDQLCAFEDELEAQIDRTLTEGVTNGEFRSDLDVAISTKLVRHMLTAVSELVAAAPDSAAHIAQGATTTVLAAIATPRHE